MSDERLTQVLMVVSDEDHPHFGCTGYLTGEVIRVLGKPMAKVRPESCNHGTDGFYVEQGTLTQVKSRRKP